MIQCPECEKDVASDAVRCPHCGHKLRMGVFGKLVFAAVVAVCGFIAIGFMIPENLAKANAARRACETELVPRGLATFADCEREYVRIKGQ